MNLNGLKITLKNQKVVVIALMTLITMKFAGDWVLLPVVLVIILAFIAGRMREGW